MTFRSAYNSFLSLTNLSGETVVRSKQEVTRSLKRVKDFLTQLGNPEDKIDFIHVAGTSGKGSVCNMLHQILLADGKLVGTYTSPHMTSYLERFQLGDKLYDPKKLAKHIQTIIREYEKFLADHEPLSFFDLSTCLAIYAFQKAGVDWCVLETGMGGRDDSTNVIPKPAVAVITNIGKEHTQFLGTSLQEIAEKKAGIMKRSGVVICGETRPSLKKVFTREAIRQQAALFFVPPPLQNKLALDLGSRQQHNAALAERSAQEIAVKQSIINSALKHYRPLPCRFETIQKSPLIILDGGHAPVKIEATAELIKKLPSKPRIIFGCKASKDAVGMLELLSPLAKSITTTRSKSSFGKVASPAQLLDLVPRSKRADYFLDFRKALKHVKKLSAGEDPIVVTGSLYLAGEMRGLWISEREILKKRSSFLK